MKTIEEKADEYAQKCMFRSVVKSFFEEKKESFTAGYKAAQEWISVEDELPENETYILVKYRYDETQLDFMFYESINIKDLQVNYSHWRPI